MKLAQTDGVCSMFSRLEKTNMKISKDYDMTGEGKLNPDSFSLSPISQTSLPLWSCGCFIDGDDSKSEGSADLNR